MAKGDNTLTYLALAAAAYWLYTRQSAPVTAVAQLATPSPTGAQGEILPGARFPYKPILRLPKPQENTITLPAGQAPPAAPRGYYWARATVGNPPEDGSITYTLLRYEYMTQKASAVQ